MNKKFSTLAVAAMLASAFTVNADPGDVVKKLEEGNNGKQYQLVAINGDGVADDQYLVLEKEKGNAYLRLKTTTDGYDLGSSLWCVNVTLENQGKNPIFDFINKAQQLVLDVTIGGYNNWDNDGASNVNADEAFVGGEVAGWEFAPVLGSDDVPMFNEETDYTGKQYSLRSYINSNEVATLVKGNDGKIHVAVYNAGDAIPWNAIKFILKEADCVTLSPEQFNTILNTRSKEDFVKLTFDKNYNNTDIVNPFSENELMAQTAVKSAANGEDASNGFVNLYRQNADGSKQYLRVDTAYTNDYGINFLKFAFSENDEPIAEEKQIANQYNLHIIMLITPETNTQRIYEIDNHTKGFIYMVSSAAITGVQKDFNKQKQAYFHRIKAMGLHNPVMIGFGISNKQTYQSAATHASGCIIGSKFISLLKKENGNALKAITELKEILNQ